MISARYMTAAGRTPEEPMGPGGLGLVELAMGGGERGRRLLDDAVGQLGASIAGRTTYDNVGPVWKAASLREIPTSSAASSRETGLGWRLMNMYIRLRRSSSSAAMAPAPSASPRSIPLVTQRSLGGKGSLQL